MNTDFVVTGSKIEANTLSKSLRRNDFLSLEQIGNKGKKKGSGEIS
jgi:hypothetical protein